MMKKILPLGVKLVCYIYLLNAILYFVSLFAFNNNILIFGKEVYKWIPPIIRIAFILIPVYLYFGLKLLRKDAWITGVSFSIFFLLNNFMTFLEQNGFGHSFIRIVGIYSSWIYSPVQLLILALNTIVNLLILVYLYQRRGYFFMGEQEH